MAFAHYSEVRRCVEGLPAFASLLPEASGAHAFALRQPVVDLSVYNRNKNFRLLSCTKRGDRTPLAFDPRYNEHPAELDALVTLVRGLRVLPPRLPPATTSTANNNAVVGTTTAPPPPAAIGGDSSESDVDRLRRTQRPRLDALRAALQALLVRFGDTNTQVRGLHQTDGWHLRWDCRNCGVRPCLLSTSEHTSNQVLLWLVPQPDAFAALLRTPPVVDVLDAYIVRYQCMSTECGKALGSIGTLRWCPARSYYEPAPRFPPDLEPAQRRPATFCRRTHPLPHAVLPSSYQWLALPIIPPPPLASSSQQDHQTTTQHNNNNNNKNDAAVEAAGPMDEDEADPMQQDDAADDVVVVDHDEPMPSAANDDNDDDYSGDDDNNSSSNNNSDASSTSSSLDDIPEEEEEEAQQEATTSAPAPAPAVAVPEGPDDPEHNAYDRVKARFELHCFKILSPFAYANLAHPDRREPDLYTPQQLRHLYANLYFFERDPETNSWQKLLFVPRWMGDVRIRQVTEIVVEPACTRDDVYNLWSPFAAERLPPVPDADVEPLVAPFIRHLHEVIADEVQAHTDWLLDYLAMILQRPSRPTHVAISIYGPQALYHRHPLPRVVVYAIEHHAHRREERRR